MRSSAQQLRVVSLLCICGSSFLSMQSGFAQYSATELSSGQVESQIAFLVNFERAAAGLSQLSHDAKLSSVARKHSEEMRDLGYFGHESPVAQHRTPEDRYLQAYGIKPSGLTENIGKTPGGLTQTAANTIHTAIMSSPQHKANALAEGATQMGIGCAVAEDGTVWTTELFVAGPAAEAEAPGGQVGPKSAPVSAPGPRAPGAQAQGMPAERRPGATERSGVVREYIWRSTVSPTAPLEVSIPVSPGTAIRYQASGSPETRLTVESQRPAKARCTERSGVGKVSNGAGDMILTGGEYRVRVTAAEPTSCRLLVVVGGPGDVAKYGRAVQWPTPLVWGRAQAGTLDETIYPRMYSFTLGQGECGRLVVRPLAGDFVGNVALYDGQRQLAARRRCSGAEGCALPLGELAPGSYVVVVASAGGERGSGDFEVLLEGSGDRP